MADRSYAAGTPAQRRPIAGLRSVEGRLGGSVRRLSAFKRIVAVWAIATCLSGIGASVASAAEYELNGLIVNPVDPGKSLAIIDGRRLRVGSRWQGLEVTEIGQGFVRYRENGSGREKILTMGASVVQPKAKTVPSVARTRATRVSAASLAKPAFLARVNPMRLVWMAYTAMAEASLRQVFTAQQLFAVNDLNYDGLDQYSGSLRELADHGLVQADLAAGKKFGYLFAARSWEDEFGPHFECIAEPVRQDTRQPYLYLDESGVIRGQLFARAGYDSPAIR